MAVDPRERKDTCLAGVITVACIAGSLIWLGPAVSGLCLAMLIAWWVHLRTLHRRMPDPKTYLPVYVGALGWQILHFIEEYATDFHTEWPALFDRLPWSDARFIGFNAVFYGLFLVSAIAVRSGRRVLCWFASFFTVAMFANAVGHVATAIWVGGYFPGLITAPFSLVWGVAIVRRLNAPTVPVEIRHGQ